jgi:hypothetical protein
MTDVEIDFPCSVNFVASGNGSLNINAVVCFKHPGGPQGNPIKDYTGCDANYFIYINNILINRVFTNVFNQTANYTPPGQITLSPGDMVSLKCLNTGEVTADYSGTLFGSF